MPENRDYFTKFEKFVKMNIFGQFEKNICFGVLKNFFSDKRHSKFLSNFMNKPQKLQMVPLTICKILLCIESNCTTNNKDEFITTTLQ